jgi:4-amino-4-deoxy-L-arabinose transferase-like glycosyltransferase
MFSPWAGFAGMLLLLVNPVMWHAGVEGPLRPNLALFSLLTAYCCWRCWNGEKRFALWGAVALGIGGGFRPDLIAFLFPLWLVSSWVGTRSWRTVVLSAGVLVAIVAAWTSAVMIAMGGFHTFRSIMLTYAADWAQFSSARPGASVQDWLLQKSRLFIWNALGIVTWIWAAPIALLNRNRPHLSRSHILFLTLWIVPGVLLQAMTHFANPGHTLFSVSALCLIGGYMISRLCSQASY